MEPKYRNKIRVGVGVVVVLVMMMTTIMMVGSNPCFSVLCHLVLVQALQ
jgi:hypothetical protein